MSEPHGDCLLIALSNLAAAHMKLGQGQEALAVAEEAVMLQRELDVICIVLGCGVDELLIPEPEAVAEPRHHDDDQTAAVGQDRQVTPRAGGGRSLPPR